MKGRVGAGNSGIWVMENANHGNISANQMVGGLIGQSTGPVTIANSYNTGDVAATVTNIAGGAVGQITATWAADAHLIRTYNAGIITTTTGFPGAIAGINGGTITQTWMLVRDPSDRAIGTMAGIFIGTIRFTPAQMPTLNGFISPPFILDDGVVQFNNGLPILNGLDYSPREGGATDPAARTTLVLLPGVMGSRLSTGFRRVWEPTAWEVISPIFTMYMKPFLLSNECGEPEHQLNARRLPGDYGARNYYMDIYHFLTNENNFPSSEFDVVFFTYDWRLSNAVNAELLQDELIGHDNIVFIAHSMGGLIVSHFLAMSSENRDRVDLLITFGTPFMGSVDAISAFEAGRQFGFPADIFLSPHIREISANTSSVYELLPTSRYGSFIYILDGGSLSYGEGRTLLSGRPWARTSTGDTKIMMPNSEQFHNNLISGMTHIANSIDSVYFVGTGLVTAAAANYGRFNVPDNLYLFTPTIYGDGTVIARSAANGRSLSHSSVITIPGGDHTRMISQPAPWVLNQIRNLIMERSFGRYYAIHELTTEFAQSYYTELEDKFVSVVIEGVESLDIYDSYGNRIIQVDSRLYREAENAIYEEIGVVFIINHEYHRYQFVMESGEYVFSNMVFVDDLMPEIMVLYFEDLTQTLIAHYSSLDIYGNSKLTISPNSSELLPAPPITDAIEITFIHHGHHSGAANIIVAGMGLASGNLELHISGDILDTMIRIDGEYLEHICCCDLGYPFGFKIPFNNIMDLEAVMFIAMTPVGGSFVELQLEVYFGGESTGYRTEISMSHGGR